MKADIRVCRVIKSKHRADVIIFITRRNRVINLTKTKTRSRRSFPSGTLYEDGYFNRVSVILIVYIITFIIRAGVMFPWER